MGGHTPRNSERTEAMKKNVRYLLAGVAVAAVLFVAGTPLRASETDERIESSFK